jgi:hypothetical protein
VDGLSIGVAVSHLAEEILVSETAIPIVATRVLGENAVDSTTCSWRSGSGLSWEDS